MTFEESLAEDRRRIVLSLLDNVNGNSLNEQVLKLGLQRTGHTIDVDLMRADLAWLHDHGLARLEKIPVSGGEMWVSHLTERGGDVAKGARHPGVARKPAG